VPPQLRAPYWPITNPNPVRNHLTGKNEKTSAAFARFVAATARSDLGEINHVARSFP
jgi:hypothetical protein